VEQAVMELLQDVKVMEAAIAAVAIG